MMNGCHGGWPQQQHQQPQQLQQHFNGIHPPHRGGRGKGASKGLASNNLHADPCNLPAPKLTVDSLQVGETVDVFHRYCQDPNGYFMVDHNSSGMMHPSVGRTDGWTEAWVSKPWDGQYYNADDNRTWVEIQWAHPRWYDRRGHRLDVSNPGMITQRVPPEQIRRQSEASEAKQVPCLTLIMVRYGGEKPVDPVTEGAGGWGQIGSTPSDNYINGFESQVFKTLGPTYEVISVFYQNSEELAKVCPSLLRNMARGHHIGALYFMWPIVFQDGHEYPAYVNKDRQLDLMVQMEGGGIPTRFPHPSHLYRMFASKEWTAQMCLHPLLKIPLTTRVSRQAIALDPAKAAVTAHQALGNLAIARSAWSIPMQQPSPSCPQGVNKGVAKLGWSWEAMDVKAWQSKVDLTNALSQLIEQPGSLLDMVFVQEWVDFDVEMRHFIIEPDLAKPESLKPKKIIYTVMKSLEEGCFRNFDRYDRQQCLRETFKNDDAALADAEQQSEELIHRWLQWIQAQTNEMPTVVRFDILTKRTGPGSAQIHTGELTELGGCFLGWPTGPPTVFAAMIRSCFKDPAPA